MKRRVRPALGAVDVLVHTGVPGDHGSYAVFGSTEGNARCAAGDVSH